MKSSRLRGHLSHPITAGVIVLVLFSGLTAVYRSCRPEEDQVAPTVLEAQPSKGSTLLPGQQVTLRLIFSEELLEGNVSGSDTVTVTNRMILATLKAGTRAPWTITWSAVDRAKNRSRGEIVYEIDERQAGNRDSDTNDTFSNADLLDPGHRPINSWVGGPNDAADCYEVRAQKDGTLVVSLKNLIRDGDVGWSLAGLEVAGGDQTIKGEKEWIGPGEQDEISFKTGAGSRYTFRVWPGDTADRGHPNRIHYELQVTYR